MPFVGNAADAVWNRLWQWLTRRFRTPDEEERELTPAAAREAAVNRYFRPAPPPLDEVKAYTFLRLGAVVALLGAAVFVGGLPAVAVPILFRAGSCWSRAPSVSGGSGTSSPPPTRSRATPRWTATSERTASGWPATRCVGSGWARTSWSSRASRPTPCTCAGWPSTVRGIFECTVDYATGAMRDEEIREFYYADITMVSLVRTAARSSPA